MTDTDDRIFACHEMLVLHETKSNWINCIQCNKNLNQGLDFGVWNRSYKCKQLEEKPSSAVSVPGRSISHNVTWPRWNIWSSAFPLKFQKRQTWAANISKLWTFVTASDNHRVGKGSHVKVHKAYVNVHTGSIAGGQMMNTLQMGFFPVFFPISADTW